MVRGYANKSVITKLSIAANNVIIMYRINAENISIFANLFPSALTIRSLPALRADKNGSKSNAAYMMHSIILKSGLTYFLNPTPLWSGSERRVIRKISF